MAKLNIVLFGATGFTGRYCITALRNHEKILSAPFTWGVAGRSEKKIKDALQECTNETGDDFSKVPVIIADTGDFESLKNMTGRADVLINCCGPYTLYGETMIKACLETGTHQVDLSGEIDYIETIERTYGEAAKEKDIFLVSACGLESVVSELGILLLQEKFEGTVNSIESYVQLLGGGGEGSSLNYTSYESVVHAIGDVIRSGKLWQTIRAAPFSEFEPTLKARCPVHKSGIINKWCIPFLTSDQKMAHETQKYLYEHENVRPIQVRMYFGVQSLCSIILVGFFGLCALLLSPFDCGRSLMLKYPSFFSGGFIKNEPPQKASLSRSRFEMTLRGCGWKEKKSGATVRFTTPPDKSMEVRLGGYDPGYTLTANIITLAAVVILTERDRLPKNGGLYTPGVVFQKTSLLQKMQDNGLSVQIVM